MENTSLFYHFGVALFIGILIGLQREYSYELEHGQRSFGGVRTFALLSLAGCTAAFAADLLSSPWAFIGVSMPLGLLIAIAYFITAWRGEIGMTTEVAAVITVLTGAMCYWDRMALAVALAVTTTSLLAFKIELHLVAKLIDRDDIIATLKFAIITAIILPVLPNRSFGPPPFDVLNPFKIWLMIVLISAIGFTGYILIKLVGSRRGIGLTGFMGGLVSSTAVTLTFAQRSKENDRLAKPFALAVIGAWVVMFFRILVVVAAINISLLGAVWRPLVSAGAVGLAYCLFLYFALRRAESTEEVALANPFALGPAITFGLMFGVILFVSRTAQIYFADAGVWVAAIVSGLTDVDAITLSMADLSSGGHIDPTTAGRAVVLAAMSNTVAKGGILLVSGSGPLRRATLPPFLLILATGVSLAFLL